MQWAISKSVEEIGEKGRTELNVADFVWSDQAQFIYYHNNIFNKYDYYLRMKVY